MTLGLITLGASDFLDFLGGTFAVMFIGMLFRIYMGPAFGALIEMFFENLEKL